MRVPLSPCRVLTWIWNPQWKILHPLVTRCPSCAPPLHATTKSLSLNQEARTPGGFTCCVLDWRALARLMTHNPSRPQYQQLFWTRRVLISIWPPRDPLLPASTKLPLSSQEALIQEVSIYCMLGWLTSPRWHPLNPIRQWSASPWEPQNTTLSVMDKSSVCTLNMLEVKPSRTKCVPGHSYVNQLLSAILNIYKRGKHFHYPMHCLPSSRNRCQPCSHFALHNHLHECSLRMPNECTHCMGFVCLAHMLHWGISMYVAYLSSPNTSMTGHNG